MQATYWDCSNNLRIGIFIDTEEVWSVKEEWIVVVDVWDGDTQGHCGRLKTIVWRYHTVHIAGARLTIKNLLTTVLVGKSNCNQTTAKNGKCISIIVCWKTVWSEINQRQMKNITYRIMFYRL